MLWMMMGIKSETASAIKKRGLKAYLIKILLQLHQWTQIDRGSKISSNQVAEIHVPKETIQIDLTYNLYSKCKSVKSAITRIHLKPILVP